MCVISQHDIHAVNIDTSKDISALTHICIRTHLLSTNKSSEHDVTTGIYVSCVSSVTLVLLHQQRPRCPFREFART